MKIQAMKNSNSTSLDQNVWAVARSARRRRANWQNRQLGLTAKTDEETHGS